jgi:hypothetical protein
VGLLAFAQSIGEAACAVKEAANRISDRGTLITLRTTT